MKITLGGPLTLEAFAAALDAPLDSWTDPSVEPKLQSDLEVVESHVNAGPVYGLNTGLGGNLEHRIAAEDIASHQWTILRGRACAVGSDLPDWAGRGITIYRLATAARGGSGMTPNLWDHLLVSAQAGVDISVPRYGSIGASDLTQNACWALEVLKGSSIALGPRDAMALINHPGLTVTAAARAVVSARKLRNVARKCLLLSYFGYAANPTILSHGINAVRDSETVDDVAGWLRNALGTEPYPARRPQEALSFRTAHLTLAAAETAIDTAGKLVQAELNGQPDSPMITTDGDMLSSPNFAAPGLAQSLQALSLARVPVATSSLERMKRMMSPELSGLPKYLSPKGGASAGMVPVQKTASALAVRVRALASPLGFDPSPVSDNVEDVAPNTFEIAMQSLEQTEPLLLLFACEALVAAQAIDLRGDRPSGKAGELIASIRAQVPIINEDRPLGTDLQKVAELLDNFDT